MLSRLKTNFDVSSRKCKEEQEREDKEKWKSLDVVVSSCPAGLGPITQNYINYNYNYIKFFISITITVIIFQINYNYTVSITITLCGTKYIYSAFVNYVFLHVLLNFNILYTIDKQI